MSFARQHSVTVTVDASGDGEGYTPAVSGRVLSVHYVKDDFANGADFTISTDVSGQTVWAESDVNASKTVAPRQATHGTDGSASLYAASGEPVEDYVWAAEERIKVVVAQGGNATSGTFIFVIG